MEKLVPRLRFPGFDGNWERHMLGDIAKFSKGKGISKADIAEDGQFECIRYGELYTHYSETIDEIKSKTNISSKDLVFSEANDVIIPGSGEKQIDIATASCVMKSGIALGGDLNVIKSSINGVFLSYYLNNTKKMEIAVLAQGNAVVHLYASQLAKLKLNVPTEQEQDRIGKFIKSIAERIGSLQKKKALLEKYKKGMMQKIFNQEVRFKDEDGGDFGAWNILPLNQIAERVTTKNKIGISNVLTISAQIGLVSQLEYFKKSVSAKDVTGYYLLERDDFAYNKSYSSGYPMGALKRLKKYDQGVVSTLYICFRFNELVDLNFIEQYFDNGLQNDEIEKVAQEGARNHGLLNVGLKEFFGIDILLPSIVEQVKIANFLSAIDDKIELVAKEIERMESWKKGLLGEMFV